jgi:hypothetical protein
VERGVVDALEALAAALQASEGPLAAGEGRAEELVVRGGVVPTEGLVLAADVSEIIFPDPGFGLAEAAEGPLGIDEELDEGGPRGHPGGGLGLVVEEVLGGEGVEAGGVFAMDDWGLTVGPRGRPGFQSILGGGGLAPSGAGTGGALRV